ncbi:hypothetical protein HY950_03735 [Candidatus Gottesmanbacteria bacterium]|nr:hypothetical protein [Candidatus Gottesmanbacteria bacterium]
MIAYQTAYLKANYPVEYMTAVLAAETRANTGPTRDDKIALAVAECRRNGILLLPPDINRSGVEFSIERSTTASGQAIRFGLSAIKNVGTAAIESILAARSARPFTDIHDVVSRVDTARVNKKTFESLIRTGAMDAFGSRAGLLAGLAEIMEETHKQKKAVAAGQVGLFDGEEYSTLKPSHRIYHGSELPREQLLAFEKELLGFYLTAHPLEPFLPALEGLSAVPMAEISSNRVGERVTVAGIVTNVKKVVTKSGNNEMAFVRLEDTTGSIELVIFPKLFARTADLWMRDLVICVSGKVDQKDDRLILLVDEAKRVASGEHTG